MTSDGSGGRLDVFSLDDGAQVYADRVPSEEPDTDGDHRTAVVCVSDRCEDPERVAELVDGLGADLGAVVLNDGSRGAAKNAIEVAEEATGVDPEEVCFFGPPKSESNDEDVQDIFGMDAEAHEEFDRHDANFDVRRPLKRAAKIDRLRVHRVDSPPGQLSVRVDYGGASALSVGPADPATDGVGPSQLRRTCSSVRNDPRVQNVVVADDDVPFSAFIGYDEFHEYIESEDRSSSIGVPLEETAEVDGESLVEAVGDGGDAERSLEPGHDAVNTTVLQRGDDASVKSDLKRQASKWNGEKMQEVLASDVPIKEAVPSVDGRGTPVLHASVEAGYGSEPPEVGTHESVEEALDAVGRGAETDRGRT